MALLPKQPAVFIGATLPKASPPEPLVTAITATDTEGVAYPDASSYDFGVSRKKRFDRYLDVYFVGVRDMYQRQWSFVIPCPPCFVTFTAAYKGEEPNSRALLCPMYGDNTRPLEAKPFIEFANHLNAISEVLKEKMLAMEAFDPSAEWTAPLKFQDNFMMGIPMKVKSLNVRNAIISCPYNIRCVIKLTCLYVTHQRRGISLECIEAFPCA